jgi:prepilin-type N-terminal cleavage/methylation domain-containing protein
MNRLPISAKRRSAGFTLVEMVFVIVLISILAGLAVPRMTGVVNWSRLDQTANQLSADVVYARTVAIGAADRVTVEFAAGGYVIRRANQAAAVKTVNFARDHAGVELSLIGPSGASGEVLGTLVYDSRGVLREGDGTGIRLQRQGRELRLSVSTTGRVQRAN